MQRPEASLINYWAQTPKITHRLRMMMVDDEKDDCTLATSDLGPAYPRHLGLKVRLFLVVESNVSK